MTNTKVFDIAIFGASPIGITAAIQATHKNQSVVLCTHLASNELPIEVPKRLQQSFFDNSTTQQFYNYWGGKIKSNTLTIECGSDISRIDKHNELFHIDLKHGNKIICKSLIICSEHYSLTNIDKALAPISLVSVGNKVTRQSTGETSLYGLYLLGEPVGQTSTVQAMNQSLFAINGIASRSTVNLRKYSMAN